MPETKRDMLFLSEGTIGEVPVLDENAVEAIHKQTGLPFYAGFDLEALGRELNQTVDFTLFRMLARPYDRRAFKKLKTHFFEYARLCGELSRSADFPPRPPLDWFEKAKLWFEQMEQVFDERGKGGAPRREQLQHLVPEALCLFESAYGARPVSTTQGIVTEDGPTARFLRELLLQIDRALAQASFDERYSQDEVDRFRHFKITDSALRKHIADAIATLKCKAARAGDPAPR